MSKKNKPANFSCRECRHPYEKWFGQCSQCQSWNSIEELKEKRDNVFLRLCDIPLEEGARLTTGLESLDWIMNGGIESSSLVLLGGSPGSGKSTLALQVALHCAQRMEVLYVTTEETLHELKRREKRLGYAPKGLYVMQGRDWESVQDAISTLKPKFVLLDSIQGLYCRDVESSLYGVAHAREVIKELRTLARETGLAGLIVCQVTKSGELVGTKMLEHLVDVVLSIELEGEKGARVLRGHKNRFGVAGGSAVLEMTNTGLV